MRAVHVAMLDDEQFWVERVAEVTDALGWTLFATAEPAGLIDHVCANQTQIVILDRMLGAWSSDSDGLAVLPRLALLEVTPSILVLSALREVRSRVEGMDQGADDYITKPFEPDELRARMQALLRHRGWLGSYNTVRVFGELEVRERSGTAAWCGKPMRLPEQSFQLLCLLAERAGSVVSKQELWKCGWPELNFPMRDTVIEVAMSRLRKLLEEQTGQVLIRSERGRGYRLDLATLNVSSS